MKDEKLKMITTADPAAERKRKKFSTQIIATTDLSDEQIDPTRPAMEKEEKEENEEQES